MPSDSATPRKQRFGTALAIASWPTYTRWLGPLARGQRKQVDAKRKHLRKPRVYHGQRPERSAGVSVLRIVAAALARR